MVREKAYKPSPWEPGEREAYYLTQEDADWLLSTLRDKLATLYEMTDAVGNVKLFLEQQQMTRTRNYELAEVALENLRAGQTTLREMLRQFGLSMPK